MRRRACLACCLLLLLAACATTQPPPEPLSPPDIKAYEVSLASSNGRLALAWHGAAAEEHDALFLRHLDELGHAAGPVLRLTDGTRRAYEPSLQLLGPDALIGWYERDDDGGLQAFAGRFAANGRVRWRVALSPAGISGRNTVLRVGARGIHVAWFEQDRDAGDVASIRYGRLGIDGKWIDTPRDVARTGRDTWNLNAALDAGGTLHVVYDARWQKNSKELQMLSISAAGVQHVLLSADDGIASQYPDLAIEGERAALTWFDERDGNNEVYLYAGTLASLRAPVDGKAIRITRTKGDSIGAYVTLLAGHIGLAWCDDTSGQYQVFAQVFDAAGNALQATQALTDGRLQGLIPSMVAWRRGFAVAWNERLAGEDSTGHSATVSSAAAVRLVPALEAPR